MHDPKTFSYRVVAREEQYRPSPRVRPPRARHLDVPPEIRADSISVVIPVKNNQAGIDRFLAGMSATVDPVAHPKEIIIVDNDSDEMTRVRVECRVPVTVLECKERGPGAARNLGVAHATGDWILFTDSDCIPTPALVSAYARADNAAIAYAGRVETAVIDPYTSFYEEQGMFLPFALVGSTGVVPGTVITANCLVLKAALEAVGGFHPDFIYAGGEDTDLGFRLRMVGGLRYNLKSVARHEIDDGLQGFMERFVRYGRGQALLAKHYANPHWFDPRRLEPLRNPTAATRFLADVYFRCLSWGFTLEMAGDFA